jgi:hypothetical protein
VRGCRAVTLDAAPRAESSRGRSRFDRGDRAAGASPQSIRHNAQGLLVAKTWGGLVGNGQYFSFERLKRDLLREHDVTCHELAVREKA